MKNVRSSQSCISMNFCTEFSKAQVFPCEYRQRKPQRRKQKAVTSAIMNFIAWLGFCFQGLKKFEE